MANPTFKLEGVIPACVTPWRHGNVVDKPALWRYLEMLLAAGVSGLAMGGSTGEFPRLDRDNYERMMRAVVEFAAKRVPVIAGCAHASIDGALEMARVAQQAGASALLAPPPIYFSYGQPEIQAYYERLVAGANLPVLLYSIPQFCSAIAPETATTLLRSGRFAGAKESGGNPALWDALFAARKELPITLLWGHDSNLLDALGRGADGCLSGIAACAPEFMVKLFRERTPALQAKLNEFIDRLGAFPAPVGVRLALEARGIPVGPHAVPIPEEKAKEFALWFEKWLAA